MRHRKAGNRISMPEPRRRAAIRSMIDGLILHEHITTTQARAKAIKAEAEHMIAMALRGRRVALAHVREVVNDESLVLALWDLAGEANFSLDTEIADNEDRQQHNKLPLSQEARDRKEQELADRKSRLLKLIKNKDEAQAALTAAREGRAMLVHARRTVARHIPNQVTLRKLFSPEFFERFENRNGGYTRISKLGRRAGDAAEMVRFELIDQL
ncbi:MAG TPA: bL17 family ribosomal protein [Ktedonobacterales bacterium]|nr:bL17 family ribosomal protein [Ktedonobacterales bacterium]